MTPSHGPGGFHHGAVRPGEAESYANSLCLTRHSTALHLLANDFDFSPWGQLPWVRGTQGLPDRRGQQAGRRPLFASPLPKAGTPTPQGKVGAIGASPCSPISLPFPELSSRTPGLPAGLKGLLHPGSSRRSGLRGTAASPPAASSWSETAVRGGERRCSRRDAPPAQVAGAGAGAPRCARKGGRARGKEEARQWPAGTTPERRQRAGGAASDGGREPHAAERGADHLSRPPASLLPPGERGCPPAPQLPPPAADAARSPRSASSQKETAVRCHLLLRLGLLLLFLPAGSCGRWCAAGSGPSGSPGAGWWALWLAAPPREPEPRWAQEGRAAPRDTGGVAQHRWLRHSRWLRAARCPPAGQVRGDGRRLGLGAAPQAGAVHYTTAPGERGRVPTGSGRPSLGPVGFRFHIAAVPGVLQLNCELLLFNVNPSEASCAAGAGGGLRSGAGAGRGVGAQSLALLPWNLLINDRYRYIYIYI